MNKAVFIVISLAIGGCVPNTANCEDILFDVEAPIRGVCEVSGYLEMETPFGSTFLRSPQGRLIGVSIEEMKLDRGEYRVRGKFIKNDDFISVYEVYSVEKVQ
jgi:hypothetical protein